MVNESMKDYLETHPARCLQLLRLESAKATQILPSMSYDPDSTIAFKLRCTCGCSSGYALGHSIQRPESVHEDILFVGPHAFECAVCGRVTPFFDPQRDGLNGEYSNSANLTGEGKTDRFQNNDCLDKPLELVVILQYDAGSFDEHPSGRAQDFFVWFSLLYQCPHSAEWNYVTDYECA